MSIVRQQISKLRVAGAKCDVYVKGIRVHVVVRINDRVYDYWPARGNWRKRDNTLRPGTLAVHRTSVKSGNGFESLLEELTQQKKEASAA
jgi:hypothetical protein